MNAKYTLMIYREFSISAGSITAEYGICNS